jgi:hypothetical protein
MINIHAIIRVLLYGFSARLRPYEKACLEAWEQHLSSEAAEIFRKQLKFCNFVQRQSKNKLVIFGYEKGIHYCQNWPTEILFPIRDENVNAAQIFLTISQKETSVKIRADINIYKGRFFSIEFNQSPNFSKSAKISVDRVWLLVDPMSPTSEKKLLQQSNSEISGWLREWKTKRRISNLKRPLLPSEREKFIAKIHSVLPQDYLEIILHSEGCWIDDCIVAGLSDIRKIVRPDANFYIIAEISNRGSIAVKEEQPNSELYYLDNENEIPQSLGQSFRKAIEIVMGTKHAENDR